MRSAVHNDVRLLRTQVIMIFAFGVGAIVAILLFVVLPLREEVRASRNEILNVEEELAAFHVRTEGRGMAEQLAEATARNRRLAAEYDDLRKRVNGFRVHNAIRQSLPTYEDGRIDFKLALFQAREQLLEKAAEAKVALPEDLGVSETIGTQERAEIRLWHLVATVRLVQLAIDARISAIGSIESGEPTALAADDDPAHAAMEFPTRMVVRCAFGPLVRFLDTISREGSFYAIRKLRVERMGTHGTRMLEAELVAGALLFDVSNASAEPRQVEPDAAATPRDLSPPATGRRGRRGGRRGLRRPDTPGVESDV